MTDAQLEVREAVSEECTGALPAPVLPIRWMTNPLPAGRLRTLV